MNFLIRRNNDSDTTNDVDVEIIPDYMFRDINIKYSMEVGENDLFYISLYGANDQFSYSIEEPYNNLTLNKQTRETNTQNGGAAYYGKTWKSGNTTNFTFAYTVFNSEYQDDLMVKPRNLPQSFQTVDKTSLNRLGEVIIKAENRFSLHKNHTLEASTGIYSNRVTIVEDTFNIKMVDTSASGSRLFIAAQDIMALGKRVILKAGFRWSYAGTLERGYLEPRISISVQADEGWKFNAAWGLYDQFVTKSTIVDEQGNYRYFWTLADNKSIPVTQASHFVLGLSLHRRGWTFELQPFFKQIDGITRYFRSQLLQWEGVLVGESRINGVDVFLQKEFGNHSAWIAYTLSKAEERFPDLPNPEWRRAFHDQRHEVKAALLLNFDPLFFSTNYVYGSGFPVAPFPYNSDEDDLTYSRWDVSFIWKFLDRKVVGEAGISLLNVLNTRNIKYTNFERIPSGQNNSINVYAEAIPFTPTLYLKFSMNSN
jgi:hypothetical protein